jgi:hypothetical protein
MTAVLTLRKTVIGGDALEDDYTVHFDGLQIGRIFRKHGVNARQVWSWNVQPDVGFAPGLFGIEDDLDTAKAAFKASWDAFWPTLSEAQVAEWRRMQAIVPSWAKRRNQTT